MNKPGNNIVPIHTEEEENPNRLPFSLEEMMAEFDNGQVPRSTYWKAMIKALYETANHVVTGVTGVVDVKPDNMGDIPLSPYDIDVQAINQDIIGRQLFYGEACKLQYQHDNLYELIAGDGYIGGIKFSWPGKQNILIEGVPNKVWIDLSWTSDAMVNRIPVINIVIDNNILTDYKDDLGVHHYLIKVADVESGSIIDQRCINIGNRQASYFTINEAKKIQNTAVENICIIERSNAIFKKVTSNIANGYPDPAKFQDNNDAWWVVSIDSGSINIKWLGAVDGGDVENSVAINAGVYIARFFQVQLYFPTGKYYINKTIKVPFGNSISIVGDPSKKHTKGSIITTDKVMTLIELQTSTQIANMVFTCTLDRFTSNTKGVLCHLTNNSDDMDCSFTGCTFSGFNVSIDARGRGLFVNNCNFIYASTFIYRSWDTQNPEYPSGNNYTDLPFGYRADSITNNRFHVLHDDGHAIRINSDSGKEWYRGAIISGNTVDLNGGLFNGSGLELTIINNVVGTYKSQTTLGAIHLGYMKNCTIANNTICCMEVNSGVETHGSKRGIVFANAFNNTITGNSIRGFKEYGIYSLGNIGTSYGNTLIGNIVTEGAAGSTGISGFSNKSIEYAAGNIPGKYNYNVATPIGHCVLWPTSYIPTGWAESAGQSTIGMPEEIIKLYGANLPDMRGEFPRGWDHGRGIDISRGLRSLQLDTVQEFTGNIITASTGSAIQTATGCFKVEARGALKADNEGSGDMVSNVKLDLNQGGVRTSTETKPRNVTWIFIIYIGID